MDLTIGTTIILVFYKQTIAYQKLLLMGQLPRSFTSLRTICEENESQITLSINEEPLMKSPANSYNNMLRMKMGR